MASTASGCSDREIGLAQSFSEMLSVSIIAPEDNFVGSMKESRCSKFCFVIFQVR